MRTLTLIAALIILPSCITMEQSPADMLNAPANVDSRVDGAVTYPELADKQRVYNRIASECVKVHGSSAWEIVSEEKFIKNEEWTGQSQTHTRLYYDCLGNN